MMEITETGDGKVRTCCMAEKKKLPIGIEDFREFKSDNFYYVDKTGFISELMQIRGKVNLFTRPRRFGKSLNMNMLKTFFEIGADASFFEGLRIAEDKEICERYMGKYPVISISLKDIDGPDFQAAYDMLEWQSVKRRRGLIAFWKARF